MSSSAPSGPDCARQFEMASSEAMKAWAMTHLLSRTTPKRAASLDEAFATNDAGAVVAFLSDVAGPAYEGYAMQSGMDVDKARSLGMIVMRLLCGRALNVTRSWDTAERLRRVHEEAKRWIEFGSIGDDAPDLQRISELIGAIPSARLAIVAPFAPAVAVCGVVARASAAAIPLFKDPSHGASPH